MGGTEIQRRGGGGGDEEFDRGEEAVVWTAQLGSLVPGPGVELSHICILLSLGKMGGWGCV